MQDSSVSKGIRSLAWPVSRAAALRVAALAAIMLLAGYLRLANIADLGYANHYYTAAIKSMLGSWHNFFYLAAEPGAALTVDKPPIGLWLQALSAAVFGINGFAMVLPQIVAGLLSILLLYHLVGRSFGPAAGLLAALALATTPVAVATDRNNTIDSTLVLALLLAAWAFIRASETGRLRHLLAGAALVGLGFNIKMMQAFLVLPALYGLYALGASLPLWRKALNLTLATLVLAGVSLSWAIAVELTPADQRPYIGSSTNNSVFELMLDHNGLKRLLGQDGTLGTPIGPGRPNPGRPGPAAGRNGPPGPPGGAPGRGGTNLNLSNPDALRLFKPALGKEASWLLPFGLIGLLLLVGARPNWPLDRRHQAALLWGGWLLTALVFFSIAEFFHEYYLSMIAPPLAALVGGGAAVLWRLAPARRWRAWGLLILAVGGTLALQQIALGVYAPAAWWRPLPIALALIGVAMAGVLAWRRSLGGQRAGYALAIGALLITPLIWSVLTMRNPSDNQSLPGAYAGVARRAPAGLEINQALLDYLAPRTQASKYLLALPSAMQGSDYVIATGRPVLYLGGFLGTDSIVSGADLSALVERGELRYLYWGAATGGFSGPGGGNAPEISRWVQDSCRAVSGFDSVAQNFGAPGGTLAQPDGVAGRGGYQIRLYDCAPAGG